MFFSQQFLNSSRQLLSSEVFGRLTGILV